MTMNTGFTTDEWTQKCVLSLENELRAVAAAFRLLRTHQYYWPPEKISEVLLIAIRLLVGNFGTQPKCIKRWKQSSAIKQRLEALLLAIKMCTGFTTDVIWMNTNVCSVTKKPFQGSSRCVSFYKDSSALLNKHNSSAPLRCWVALISAGRNASVTSLRRFASDLAHFCVHPCNICG